MIETVVLAAALLMAAVVVFGISVRVGMLLGRRLDRSLEERPPVDGPAGEKSASIVDADEAHRSAEPTGATWYRDRNVGSAGQEEMRRG